MSHPLKKPRAVFPEEKYVPQDSDDEMEQDEMIGETINVEFMGYPAEDSDFHGIKRMIQQTFRGLEVDISGVADTIISQNYVGSVIKQIMDDDDDEEEESEMQQTGDTENDAHQVFGVSTVLNLTSRKDEAPIAGLRTALVEKCGTNGTDSTNQLLRDILGNESKHIGLLISERLVNLPPQFVLPVFESMMQEIEKAKAKKMPYDFAYVLMICKIYKEKKKQKQSEDMFANPEEEIFAEESVVNFEYNVQGTGDTAFGGSWEDDDAQYIPFRRVLLLKTADIPKIISKVNESCNINYGNVAQS